MCRLSCHTLSAQQAGARFVSLSGSQVARSSSDAKGYHASSPGSDSKGQAYDKSGNLKKHEANEANKAQRESDERHVKLKKKKTIAQLDEDLRLKMEGLAGDGGQAGAELEDGKPVAMKRGVKENMFRLI